MKKPLYMIVTRSRFELPVAVGDSLADLAQLAEEAAELAQAALKLRRALDGTNPTPLRESEARAALAEERTDVSLAFVIRTGSDILNTA